MNEGEEVREVEACENWNSTLHRAKATSVSLEGCAAKQD